MSSFADAFYKAKNNGLITKPLITKPSGKKSVETLKDYFGITSDSIEKLGFESADDGHDLVHLIVAGVPELMASGMDLTSAFDKISKEKVDSLVWSKAEILVAVYDYILFIENDKSIFPKPTLEQKIAAMKVAMSEIFDHAKEQYNKNPDIKFSKIESVDKLLKEDIKNGNFRVPSTDDIEFHVNRARSIRKQINLLEKPINGTLNELLEMKLSNFSPNERDFQLYDTSKIASSIPRQ